MALCAPNDSVMNNLAQPSSSFLPRQQYAASQACNCLQSQFRCAENTRANYSDIHNSIWKLGLHYVQFEWSQMSSICNYLTSTFFFCLQSLSCSESLHLVDWTGLSTRNPPIFFCFIRYRVIEKAFGDAQTTLSTHNSSRSFGASQSVPKP